MTSISDYFKKAQKVTPDLASVANSVSDTPIIEHTPSFIAQNAQKITAKIGNAGQKILENAKSNPKAYLAGAGVAALVAGVAMGRISKSNNSDENTKTEIIHVKMKIN
jgi:hypothetical protein